ncbi:MAG TPA: helix-turn-helix domain-containing protein [Candidatus Limnocylindrales bacterium]|jgi:predicted ArsR family transcriptional regulator|nr:helix-turn-helix domain-containing protein [Candidatus Limnocylindrales bacterium]
MSEPRPTPRINGGPSPTAPAVVDGTAAVVDTVAGSSTLRRELLLRLRHDGPSSPERLASALGVSRTGVLQQLHGLEAAGLVAREAIRHGVGRPRHVYDITPAAQDLFPTNYDGLASGLLAAIHAIGGDDLVEDVFEERKRLTRDRVRQRLAERIPSGAPLVERTRELAVIQDEQGYLAEATVGADGVIRLVERNCAIHRVAADHAAACQAELDLFREILGTSVVRETHIAAGDRCCTYRVGGPTD